MKLELEIEQLAEGHWVATGKFGDKATIVTEGCTEEELYDMIADACMCVRDVEICWWNRFLAKLRWYGWKHFLGR